MQVDGDTLCVGDEIISLSSVGRIVVVGGGKASGAMAAALERAVGVGVLRSKGAVSCVNVPEGEREPTELLNVREVRPRGANEPTEAAAEGVDEMLRLVSSMSRGDLCFCLISGGGSALLPAPIEGISLVDKIELTRELSARGAAIGELNAVRRALSRVKGGGLARACGGGRLISLIISDVPGDDLATIASGPTVDSLVDGNEAIEVLRRFRLEGHEAGQRAIKILTDRGVEPLGSLRAQVTNLIIGNNARAVDGAGVEAEKLGYSHAMLSAAEQEGRVEDVARWLVDMAVNMRENDGPDCLISGGEPTVELAPEKIRGKGGRNQQLCMEAMTLMDDSRDIAFLSGGTDGEDGPTKAAGAFFNEEIFNHSAEIGSDLDSARRRNNGYHYFLDCGGSLETGPTHTNVGDLRVITVSR